jgi:hypothetical protein
MSRRMRTSNRGPTSTRRATMKAEGGRTARSQTYERRASRTGTRLENPGEPRTGFSRLRVASAGRQKRELGTRQQLPKSRSKLTRCALRSGSGQPSKRQPLSAKLLVQAELSQARPPRPELGQLRTGIVDSDRRSRSLSIVDRREIFELVTRRSWPAPSASRWHLMGGLLQHPRRPPKRANDDELGVTVQLLPLVA